MASASVTIRMDENLKKQLETIFDEMGLNMTTAITLFGKTVARQRKIPFEITADPLPNPDTFDNDTDYLHAITGMKEKIMAASAEGFEHAVPPKLRQRSG